MAGKTKPYISELEHEAATTRRVLERVPEDRLDWRPHPKSMTLGQLALHVATIPGSIARIGRLDGLDMSKVDFKNQPSPQSAEELLPALEKAVDAAQTFLGELDDEQAVAPWRMTSGEREIATIPRLSLLRNLMFNHVYHHRGQLVLYLRLLDVPVPSVYGPTADESPFAAA